MMKFSLKLDDDRRCQSHGRPPLLLRTKIPISIFNLPFFSHFTTSTANPSQLSLALSTNFSTGPSLKLSYATAATAVAVAPPLTLTLKSGAGLFGSPKNSPLVISAQFSFNPSNPNNPNPTFCLHFKPQLGSFSLRKSTFSHSKPDLSSRGSITDTSFDSNSFDFVTLERPIVEVKDSRVGENGKDSIFKGIQLAAATQMTVAKRAALSFRWLMEFPEENSAITMPVLRIKKIGIQRIPDDRILKVEGDEKIARRDDDSERDLEILKGACSWMKNELNDLARTNREMNCELEELKLRNSESFELKGIQKKNNFSGTSGFEQWKGGRSDGGAENVHVNRRKEDKKKNDRRPSKDVESELQKAIMAAEAAAAASS